MRTHKILACFQPAAGDVGSGDVRFTVWTVDFFSRGPGKVRWSVWIDVFCSYTLGVSISGRIPKGFDFMSFLNLLKFGKNEYKKLKGIKF